MLSYETDMRYSKKCAKNKCVCVNRWSMSVNNYNGSEAENEKWIT